jgi:glycosyltransferase involved in cell wall biosynthesis
MKNVKNKKLLTIAIPTFDRNEILLKNLNLILPQMEDWVDLLIVDNNSKIPVSETLKTISDNFPDKIIRIFRNSANIGGNANVLRCIEYCDAEYIWILGDDDFPDENALKKIYKYINNREAVWINFYSADPCQPKRNGGGVYQNLTSFLQELKSISELVFVSNNIYRTDCIKNGLEFGNMYQSMMAPHLISMISGIEKSMEVGSYKISTDELFSSISNNKDTATAWPLYKAFVGIMALNQVPFSNDVARHILRLVRGARFQWLRNKDMFVGFSNLSLRYGRMRSFLLSSNFCISLLLVDRFKFIITFPIYIVSITLGSHIMYFYNKFLRGLIRQTSVEIIDSKEER